MPRAPRLAYGGVIYHVMNRRVGRQTLFHDGGDFAAFLKVIGESVDRGSELGHGRPEVFACCLMGNHWHLLVRPHADGQLSRWLGWLTLTHTQRYHASHGSTGEGPIYQGRFRSFPVQEPSDGRESGRAFWEVARYVEANPVRAGLVEDAAEWPWGSLALRPKRRSWLCDWPVPAPTDWHRQVSRESSETERAAIETSLNRGRPHGSADWSTAIAARLGLETTFRPRGRPRVREET